MDYGSINILSSIIIFGLGFWLNYFRCFYFLIICILFLYIYFFQVISFFVEWNFWITLWLFFCGCHLSYPWIRYLINFCFRHFYFNKYVFFKFYNLFYSPLCQTKLKKGGINWVYNLKRLFNPTSIYYMFYYKSLSIHFQTVFTSSPFKLWTRKTLSGQTMSMSNSQTISSWEHSNNSLGFPDDVIQQLVERIKKMEKACREMKRSLQRVKEKN